MRTTMPALTSSVQEACGFGIGRRLPSGPGVATSTRHCRQAPAGASSGWSQNRGMAMPISSAARITRVPLGTLTSTSSIESVTRSTGVPAGRSGRALAVTVIRRLAPAKTVEATGSNGQPPSVRCRRYSSRKYWMDDVIGLVAPSPRAQNERPRMLSQMSSSLSRSASSPLPVLQPAQHLHQPVGALAARGALAAGLVRVELGPAQHRADHAGGVVEDLQRPGAEHRAGRGDRLEVQRDVQVLVGEQRGGRAARRPELQLVPGRGCRRPCRAARAG